MNQIVLVNYDSATSTVICQFMRQTNTSKSCIVTYGRCNQMMVFTSHKTSNRNSIEVSVDRDKLECYNVTAISDEATIIVEGQELINTGNLN